ncbi:hypothetical protein ACHAPT_004091 [Fusarium lateritium]
MEDPWGSPWTNDSPPKIDLPAPPPHAHFTPDHSQRASPAHTPWVDDDDAWGGWAEPGKDSSPRWGRSPGLRPIGGSPASSRLPSPGPDSWGHLATLETARVRKEERSGDSAISLGEGLRPIEARVVTRTPPLMSDLKESTADIWRQPDRAPSTRSLSPMPSDDGRPGSPDGAPRPALQRGTRPTALRQPSNKVQELVGMYDDMAKRSYSVSPVDPSMRKASSNGSPVQEATPEPEVKERLEPEPEPELEPASPIDTKVETKVEPEMPPEAVEETTEEEKTTEEKTEEDEAHAESDSWSDFESPIHEEVLEKPETKVAEEKLPVAEAPAHDEPQQPLQPRPKRPSIPFSIDMSKLNNLFPSVETSFPTPEPVPDVIIDDTFASISERKAWYQISRFGSIRKHNLGDDENYVRVGWGNSQVREQAIRIVRRWMEEDSIAGRVVLGRRGGAAGAKIFNWDSSAPQVEISELLAARKSHSRQASVNSKGTAASPTGAAFGWGSSPVASSTVVIPPPASDRSPVTETSSAVESSPVEVAKTSPVTTKPPAPSARSPTIARPPSPIKPTPIKPTTRPLSISQPLPSPTSPQIPHPPSPVIPTPLQATTRPLSISQPIPVPKSPLAQPPENAGWGDEEEDDDDWGDMVSSPSGEANGTFTSLDAIVDANTEDKKGHVSKPSITVPDPMDDFLESNPKEETSINDRASLDVPVSQGFMPTHSRSTTVDWSASPAQGLMPSHSRSTTVDLSPSPVQGLISHSRSTTVDLSGMPRSSLDVMASANLMQNKARSPIENTNKLNGWGSWDMDLFSSNNKPSSPMRESSPLKESMSASQELEPVSKPLEIVKAQTLAKKPRPVSLPVPPRQQPEEDTSKDDEVVANILRDLPDLSYMLR